MKYSLLLLILLLAGPVILSAQCPPEARGNNTGRRFKLFYNNQTDRDNANLSSIVVGGSTYNVQDHPTQVTQIRTTPTQADGTFSNVFTGTITLNISGGGTASCTYNNNALPLFWLEFKGSEQENGIIIN